MFFCFRIFYRYVFASAQKRLLRFGKKDFYACIRSALTRASEFTAWARLLLHNEMSVGYYRFGRFQQLFRFFYTGSLAFIYKLLRQQEEKFADQLLSLAAQCLFLFSAGLGESFLGFRFFFELNREL